MVVDTCEWMHLNREVCRQCIKPCRDSSWNEGILTFSDSGNWESGFVSCPSFPGNTETPYTVDIDKPPPDWCPCKFEHAVAWALESGDQCASR